MSRYDVNSLALKRTPWPNALLGIVMVASIFFTQACERKETPAPADQTYTVRARLDAVPGLQQYLNVRHEHIEDFVGKDGRVVGMKEMSMDFPDLSPKAIEDLKAIKIGQGIEMTFEVRWKSKPRTLVTAIRPLRDDEALQLKGSAKASDEATEPGVQGPAPTQDRAPAVPAGTDPESKPK